MIVIDEEILQEVNHQKMLLKRNGKVFLRWELWIENGIKGYPVLKLVIVHRDGYYTPYTINGRDGSKAFVRNEYERSIRALG